MTSNPKSTTRTIRKSWNFSLSETESLHSLLERVLEPLGCSALILPDGTVLHIRPSGPADLATIPQAASLCQQYLRLGDGDVAMLNDPYSGGTHLSELTLVMGVTTESPGREADLLLVRRLALPVRLAAGTRIDDEGVRIPPTPLVSSSNGRGDVNAELLAAVAMHPLAPPGFGALVTEALKGLEQVRTELKSIARDPGTDFKRSNFRRYLADSSQAFQVQMGRLPLGSTVVSTTLPEGELVKLSLNVTESRVHFDFAGTDASNSISLTEMATFSACVAAIASVLHDQIPMNAGCFEHIQVSTPSKTLLSARAPARMFRGMNEGIALVAKLVHTALGQLNSTLRTAEGAGSDSHLQIAFASGRIFSDRLTPGSGAQKLTDGTDALALWAPQLGSPLSLEATEREFPLRWKSAGLRTGSGGKGVRRGGDGTLRSFELLEPGILRWLLGASSSRQNGCEGGRPGLAGVIEVVRANGEKTEYTAAEGEVSLQPGDVVHVLASGGGGFGEPTES